MRFFQCDGIPSFTAVRGTNDCFDEDQRVVLNGRPKQPAFRKIDVCLSLINLIEHNSSLAVYIKWLNAANPYLLLGPWITRHQMNHWLPNWQFAITNGKFANGLFDSSSESRTVCLFFSSSKAGRISMFAPHLATLSFYPAALLCRWLWTYCVQMDGQCLYFDAVTSRTSDSNITPAHLVVRHFPDMQLSYAGDCDRTVFRGVAVFTLWCHCSSYHYPVIQRYIVCSD